MIFLPTDPNILFERLLVLIGEHEAGNNNSHREGSAILDELLRANAIDKDQYVKLFILINDE